MSIIHEALKKAEREREPRQRRLPLVGGGRLTRRRWHPGVATGMLIGLITIGFGSLWPWLYAPWMDLWVSTVGPMEAKVATKALEREDQNPPQTFIAPSPPIRPPRAEAPSPPPHSVQHATALPTLTGETQVAAREAFERARTAESKGQWEEAMGYYRQSLTLNPTLMEARNNLGTLYVRQQQLTAAIDEFRAAIRLDPNYAMVRNNLGSAYILSGQEALAIQEFLAALHIDGTYVSPLYNLASLYARRGDVGQTVAFLTRALAIEPTVLSWLQEDPDFDGIKAAPDFQRLYMQAQAKR